MAFPLPQSLPSSRVGGLSSSSLSMGGWCILGARCCGHMLRGLTAFKGLYKVVSVVCEEPRQEPVRCCECRRDVAAV
jgi:hypothetical protein